MNPIPGVPQQQQQAQHQPMQEVYPSTAMSVQDNPDGSRILVLQIPLPRKNIIVPLTVEEAEDIGSKLMAPAVRRAAPASDALIIAR